MSHHLLQHHVNGPHAALFVTTGLLGLQTVGLHGKIRSCYACIRCSPVICIETKTQEDAGCATLFCCSDTCCDDRCSLLVVRSRCIQCTAKQICCHDALTCCMHMLCSWKCNTQVRHTAQMQIDIADGSHNSPLPPSTVRCVLHPEHKFFQYKKEAEQHARFVRYSMSATGRLFLKTFLAGAKKGVTKSLMKRASLDVC